MLNEPLYLMAGREFSQKGSSFWFERTGVRFAPAANRRLHLAPTALASLETKPVGAPIASLKTKTSALGRMERAKGIEPSYRAWQARVLPLYYARKVGIRRQVSCVEIIIRIFSFINFLSAFLILDT